MVGMQILKSISIVCNFLYLCSLLHAALALWNSSLISDLIGRNKKKIKDSTLKLFRFIPAIKLVYNWLSFKI